MKKKTGPVLGLYPMPPAAAGTMVAGKPNWLPAGYMGIIGRDLCGRGHAKRRGKDRPSQIQARAV